MFSVEGAGDAAFVASVLEVYDIVGLYLLQVFVLLEGAVLDEFPKALALVLVDDGDSSFFGFFDRGTIPDVFPAFIALGQRVQFLVLIQVGVLVVFCEVHVAVGIDVIDE